MNGGVIISAPSSGAGKTTVTLAILRLLSNNGIHVRGAKSGPDYIDPRFHEAACGESCFNLDTWAMRPERIRSLASGNGILVIEGAMGLFDGAPPDGKGAVADLARMLELPVVLVIDSSRTGHSVAPLAAGFINHDPDVYVAGLILNRVRSHRHESILRKALAPLNLPVIATLGESSAISLPSRHLGLVQAEERDNLRNLLDKAALDISGSFDMNAFLSLAAPVPMTPKANSIPPPAQKIAIARDGAFTFLYRHLADDWRSQGAEIAYFSPLADERVPKAEFIYLPGGYPELHAKKIAGSGNFIESLRHAAYRGASIYGECGGYMVLGRGLIDSRGCRHAMTGLLELETSFEAPSLHLGYRDLVPLCGPFKSRLKGHEFHYSAIVSENGSPLFAAWDSEGKALSNIGLSKGRVSGSFAHVIDAAS